MPSHIDVSSGHALNVSIENSSGSDLSKNFTSLHSAALTRVAVAPLSIIGSGDSDGFRTFLALPLLEEEDSAMVVEIVLAILRFDILLKCKQIIMICCENYYLVLIRRI